MSTVFYGVLLAFVLLLMVGQARGTLRPALVALQTKQVQK